MHAPQPRFHRTARRIDAIRRTQTQVAALAVPAAGNASQGRVISLIKAMAPAQGVPTWFALRIAHVESNYNPHMRGSAGEYGVFQMKCATAKDIGFRGNCGGAARCAHQHPVGPAPPGAGHRQVGRQPASGGVEAQWRAGPPHHRGELRRQGVLKIRGSGGSSPPLLRLFPGLAGEHELHVRNLRLAGLREGRCPRRFPRKPSPSRMRREAALPR